MPQLPESLLRTEPRPERVLRTAGIVGLGAATGGQTVPTTDVAARVGVDEAWILRRTGIASRPHIVPGETTASLAVRAGADALAAAGVDALDVDLVLVATVTADLTMPNAGPTVAADLGCLRAGAFDVGMACAGFLGALTTGAAQIEARRADTVLVVGVDRMSTILDPADRRTAPLFGDAAGAVVLRADTGATIGPTRLGTDGSLRDAIVAPVGGTMAMDGHSTFNAAIALMTAGAHDVCERAGITVADLALFVPHQANARITAAVGEKLGLRPEQVVDTIRTTGNTSSASVPLALVAAQADGRLPVEGPVLLAAVGAGFSWGAALVEWHA